VLSSFRVFVVKNKIRHNSTAQKHESHVIYQSGITEYDGFHMFGVMYFIAYSIYLYYPQQQFQINLVINNRGI